MSNNSEEPEKVRLLENASKQPEPAKPAKRMPVLAAYGLVVVWMFVSGGVVMVNKYVLDPNLGKFPYPLALTSIHMAVSWTMAWLLMATGVVQKQPVKSDMYLRCIAPIGALFAVMLWSSNLAYLYLSVSFVQMLKAALPLVVYIIGCIIGTERITVPMVFNMFIVVGGVAAASYGELHFVWIGVIIQCGSILVEAVRVTMVQLLLQANGIKLNPVNTIYCVAPVSLVCMAGPLLAYEMPKMLAAGVVISPWILLFSALLAFALNVVVFLIIGALSALTMNVAGVVKDVLLIGVSSSVFGAPVTTLQIGGFGCALVGVMWYNYMKIRDMATRDAEVAGRTQSGRAWVDPKTVQAAVAPLPPSGKSAV